MAAVASQNFVEAGAAAIETASRGAAAVTATLPHGPPVPLTAAGAAVYLDDERRLQELASTDQQHRHRQQQSPRKVS